MNQAISNRLSGNYNAMESLLSESLEFFTELGHKVGAHRILSEQANLAFLQRNYKQASLLCEKILMFAREIGSRGDEFGELTALRRLGHVAYLEGDYNKAHSLLFEALTGAKEINNQELIVSCLEELATLSVFQGQAKRSATLFGATEILRKTDRHAVLAIDTIEVDKSIQTARAQLDDDPFNVAWLEGCAMTMEQAIAYSLEGNNK